MANRRAGFSALAVELQLEIAQAWSVCGPSAPGRPLETENRSRQALGLPEERIELDSRCEQSWLWLRHHKLSYTFVNRAMRREALRRYFTTYKFDLMMGAMDAHSLYHIRAAMDHYRRLSGNRITDIRIKIDDSNWDGTLASAIAWTLFFAYHAAHLSPEVTWPGQWSSTPCPPYPRPNGLLSRYRYFRALKDFAFRLHEEGKHDRVRYIARGIAEILRSHNAPPALDNGDEDESGVPVDDDLRDYAVIASWSSSDPQLEEEIARAWVYLRKHYLSGHETMERPCPHALPTYCDSGSAWTNAHWKHWYKLFLPATTDASDQAWPWVESYIGGGTGRRVERSMLSQVEW